MRRRRFPAGPGIAVDRRSGRDRRGVARASVERRDRERRVGDRRAGGGAHPRAPAIGGT